MMTWKELRDFIDDNPHLLSDSVTVYDRSVGEYYPADVVEFMESDDVLDEGSIFIVIDT